MKKRRNHDAGFKARVGLEALKGERTVSELAAEYGVHPTMIHQWKKALLEGAADIFERGGKKAPEVDEDTVRALHAKIGELAAARQTRRDSASIWMRRCCGFVKSGGLCPTDGTGPQYRDKSRSAIAVGPLRCVLP